MAELSKTQLEAIAKYLDCKVSDIVTARDTGLCFVVLVDRGIAGTPKFYVSYEHVKQEQPKPKPKTAPETRTRRR